jgi:hypothetical protein
VDYACKRAYAVDFLIVLFYNVFVIYNFELYDDNFVGIIFYILGIIYMIIYFLFDWFIERFDN